MNDELTTQLEMAILADVHQVSCPTQLEWERLYPTRLKFRIGMGSRNNIRNRFESNTNNDISHLKSDPI